MPTLKKTKMYYRYIVKLVFRLVAFISVFSVYIYNKKLLWEFMNYPIYNGIHPLHILWLAFMIIMICHIFPFDKLSMALRKAESDNYREVEGYSELELLKFVQGQNIKAWKVMRIWLSFNAGIGILYLLHVLDESDLLMITVCFFLCDYICILFFCPFQTYIMKNKCCVNCRIYDWGHFMMFTPMLFIKNFFSWSLFFTSIVVLIHWEIIYASHPERFFYGSNKTLQCANCKDKTCGIKNKLSGKNKVKRGNGINE